MSVDDSDMLDLLPKRILSTDVKARVNELVRRDYTVPRCRLSVRVR